MSTAPAQGDDAAGQVGIGITGWLRWVWRTLTSMRTALILLFLLAVASSIGSFFPQRGTNPMRVTDYLANDPKGPFLDKLGFFDVFSAPWFAAIYLLLFVSLAGCVLPRSLQHWRAVRTRPPAAPRNLARLPEHRVVEPAEGATPQGTLDAAAAHLRRRRWRVDTTAFDGRTGTVAAEKGYSRETGNLVFHLALLGLLLAVAYGSLYGFKGTVIVREGSTFADNRAQFDAFAPGVAFDSATLPPFAFTLDRFTADYQRGGQQNGAAREFSADVTVVTEPGAAPHPQTIQVNDPLEVGGVKVFLVGHGYAPTITIKDSDGNVVFHDSVVFLPQDSNFTSTGVVKAPDTVPQLGLQGFFLPTAAVDQVQGPHSTFPAPDDPAVFLSAWAGDLGLDSGVPQSVYKLDTSRMTRLGIDALRPGESWTLPGGHGTVTFDGFEQWASFSVARDPGMALALLAALLAITGLALSLLVRRRRVWVRVSADEQGVTVVEVAGLTRSEHTGVTEEVDALAGELGTTTTTTSAGRA
ncbi:MAG: cytochrome c biogenesis protein ResB [Frankiales bacterium]|nr:cytochrome c biogenesis protein ResB [Frankiales bacterium]